MQISKQGSLSERQLRVSAGPPKHRRYQVPPGIKRDPSDFPTIKGPSAASTHLDPGTELQSSKSSKSQRPGSKLKGLSGGKSNPEAPLASPQPSQQRHEHASTNQTGVAARREAKFSLSTYKHHALGDYVQAIRRYGTTDSYSTESVSPGTYFRNVVTWSDSPIRANLNTALQNQGTSARVAKLPSNRWHKLNDAKLAFDVFDRTINKQGKF